MKQKQAVNLCECSSEGFRHSRDFQPPPLKTGTLQASYHCFSGSYPHVWLLEHAHEVFVRAEIEGREEARLGRWRRGGRREVGWDKKR